MNFWLSASLTIALHLWLLISFSSVNQHAMSMAALPAAVAVQLMPPIEPPPASEPVVEELPPPQAIVPSNKPAATPKPTPLPTAQPTPQPTPRPTVQPTAQPTAQPTLRVTPQPTRQPTSAPTAVATTAPISPPARQERVLTATNNSPAATTNAKAAAAAVSDEVINALDEPPRFKVAPAKPEYPRAARQRRQEGTVWLEVAIDAQGQTTAIKLAQSSGHNQLDQAALAAVKKWQFLPRVKQGVAVPHRIRIPVRFQLK